ncbi:MAG: DUF6483 family protein [Anaerolineae bacterium]|nr:DUF6483 family protein [Anaerolineae bacterium]MCO5188720.1 DUF6483 family protein [Anaerolineae bacterium]MCO5193615.1 DUF6483 family protein [Anaerolineae bacterium]MCO5197466.1 DUF6483 family protein [Anaerolineae bacterium]MCO5205686.1 DUF6483 family protein [Anaerolineae bacterium]
MLKDDYIMKIVEQAGAVLRQLMRLIDERRIAEAEQEIEEALTLYVGLNLDTVNRLSAEQLAVSLHHGEMGGAGEVLMLAGLLTAQAELEVRAGNEDAAYAQRLKALELHLDTVIGHDLTHIPTDDAIEMLLQTLDEYVLPERIMFKLFVYQEKSGRYDSAENTLFELIETYVTQRDMVEEGLAFYERLLQKSDYELQAGGLPREEILNSINELWSP